VENLGDDRDLTLSLTRAELGEVLAERLALLKTTLDAAVEVFLCSADCGCGG
jgi:hypothetical protein